MVINKEFLKYFVLSVQLSKSCRIFIMYQKIKVMPRKTVSVVEMLKFANESLAHKDNSIEFKEGVCSMIEKILHKSDNYNGFMFLDQNEASIIYKPETREYKPNAAHVTRKYFSPHK